MDWKGLATAKFDSILASIPEEWRLSTRLDPLDQHPDATNEFILKHLTSREIEITETDAVEIVARTSSGKWLAEEVTKAFCHRASLAHELTNCLHEIFFDAAVADARKLDQQIAQGKAPVGPLHGLPVSLKDQFHVRAWDDCKTNAPGEDVETSMGYVGWVGTFEGKKGTKKEKRFESELVRELRAMGAILYVKTSVPHSLMSGETINNIIGYTTNPRSKHLAVGGSSGGEGALIGLRGSPLGLGTDIGGSIRIPAGFNGICGLRPSSGRLPYEGMANSMDGQISVPSVVGPLAPTPRALKLMVTSVLGQQPWLHDPLCHELPWNSGKERAVLDAAENKTLSFGILRHDGAVTPHPPVRRAVEKVAKMLEQLGHQLIDWQPPAHSRGLDIIDKAWKYDGGLDVHNALGLSGEPIASQVAMIYGEKPVAQASATEISANNIAKRNFQKDYLDYWNSTAALTKTQRPVDAIIAPLAPFSAARIGRFKYYGYTSIFNVLDYSSCAIPVSTVNNQIDQADSGFEPLHDFDREVARDYDPDIYHGSHVAIQVVGRRLQEETVLALAEYILREIKTQT